MSQTSEPDGPEQTIVIHGPITGDADRLEAVASLPDPAYVTDETALTATPAIQPAPAVASTAVTERALGLDAFRGVFLLAMNFAFTIPHWGPFPGWMYHMQIPPAPSAAYVEASGLTWRDMLFPGFLFTMSAAIPITMGARLAKRMPYPQIAWIALRRGALLLLFALIIGHVNPYWTRDDTKLGNVAAIFGLVVSFAFFVRPRKDWNPATVQWLRYTAWLGVATVLFIVPAWYGQAFSLDRRDDVIAAIAFLTVAGTMIWLLTRFSPVTRVAILALVIAGRTAAAHVGWIGSLWYSSPAQWLYQPWYLELLLVVIPGTIAGDLLVQWMRRAPDAEAPLLWSSRRLAAIAAIAASFAAVLVVGLYERRHPGTTTAAVIGLAALLLYVARKPRSARDYVITRLCAWAAFWLVVGILIEPLEGGIKKDPQTLGYLMLMTGTAIAGLTSLLIIIDGFKVGERHLRPLVQIGQNPLFAYVVFFLGITHVLWLMGIGDVLTSSWQEATLRGILCTALVGVTVWLTTKKRLLWRA